MAGFIFTWYRGKTRRGTNARLKINMERISQTGSSLLFKVSRLRRAYSLHKFYPIRHTKIVPSFFIFVLFFKLEGEALYQNIFPLANPFAKRENVRDPNGEYLYIFFGV